MCGGKQNKEEALSFLGSRYLQVYVNKDLHIRVKRGLETCEKTKETDITKKDQNRERERLVLSSRSCTCNFMFFFVKILSFF